MAWLPTGFTIPLADAEVSWWVVDARVGTGLQRTMDALVPEWIAAAWLTLPDMERPAMQVFLETDRLVLRRFTSADADNLVSLDADPDVMHYVTGGVPTPREEIENEVLPAFLGYYQRYEGYGFRAVIEKETGEFLGWFHFRPYEDGAPARSTSVTGCASQPGARGTPPRGHAR